MPASVVALSTPTRTASRLGGLGAAAGEGGAAVGAELGAAAAGAPLVGTAPAVGAGAAGAQASTSVTRQTPSSDAGGGWVMLPSPRPTRRPRRWPGPRTAPPA